MKKIFRTVKASANIRLGLIGALTQSVVLTAAALIFDNIGREYLVLGIIGVVGPLVLFAGARLVDEVLEGEIVSIEQQPQLTDVQTHMRRTTNLSQVA